MTARVLICLAPGSEETEAITTLDLLVRAGIHVTTASVETTGEKIIQCSRGVNLVADTCLIDVVENDFDALVLPGGLAGTRYFSQSTLLIEKIKRMHLDHKIIAAICAAPAIVLVAHQLFPLSNMTGTPSLQQQIPTQQWINKRVVFDARFNLLTSQGLATSIDFALKLIALLTDDSTAAQVAKQLVLPGGIFNYQSPDTEH